jgi:hypothetical protein
MAVADKKDWYQDFFFSVSDFDTPLFKPPLPLYAHFRPKPLRSKTNLSSRISCAWSLLLPPSLVDSSKNCSGISNSQAVGVIRESPLPADR